MRSGTATQTDVLNTIRRVAGWGYVIDPHTAVGMHVGLKLCNHDQKIVVAETAQPAKFADTIREALGYEPPIPKGFEKLMTLPEHSVRIKPDAEVVKKFIAAHV